MNRAQFFLALARQPLIRRAFTVFRSGKEPDTLLGPHRDELNVGHCYFVFALAEPKML